MEHLALEVFDLPTKENPKPTGSQYAVLEPNATITITDTSEIFADGDVWSYDFTLNVHANAHLFGTVGDIHGSRLHEQINKRKARLWVEGVPLYLGYLKLGDEVEVDAEGNVDVSFESGQKTFDEMIEGAKANQVPMMSDVKFGVALWRKRWAYVALQLEASAVLKEGPVAWVQKAGETTSPTTITHEEDDFDAFDEDPQLTYFMYDGEDDGNSVQEYPRMVFPKGKFDNLKTGEKDEEIDCLNTDYPYDDAHPYCNVALCYQKSGYTVTKEENGTKTTYDDYSSEPKAQRGYEVMPANRVNSAPNFYVIYWLRSLMKHLGIYIEENQMMDVEDLRRLFFVNTNCAYKEVKKLRNPSYDWSLGKYQFGSGGSLLAEYFGDLKDEKYGNKTKRYDGIKKLMKIENCGFECKGFTAGDWKVDGKKITWMPEIDHIDIKVKSVAGMSSTARRYYDGNNGKSKSWARNMFLHDAIATSECFPDTDISEVISAIENGFGVRFLFDDSYQRVRIVLLRNIFRSEEVQDIQCEIISESKQENSIRGFRMTYGDSEDTHFFYKGFDDKLPKKAPYFVDDSDKHDYSYWDLNADYGNLLHKVTAFDKTCYIDPKTGNSYIIKVDKDAKRYDDLHPSLFEGAGFMDAEDGDCTGEDETIKTINVGFSPAIMNDINFENERNGDKGQQFAIFVDAEMRPRRPDLKDLPNTILPGVKSYNDADAVYSVDELYKKHGPKGSDVRMVNDGVVVPGSFAITSDMYAEKTGLSTVLVYRKNANRPTCEITNLSISGHVNEGYRLYLQDNYEPNDDGISPIEKHDWGVTLGIMRGSGSDAYVDYSADPDDGEENDTWDIVSGSSVTAHPDTCDSYGNEWDYNGDAEGIGDTDGRVSLKLRAEKPNPYYDPKQPESDSNRRYLQITNPNLQQRGLADQFYKEYSYWIRNARIVKRTVRMTLAQLLTIDKTKRVRFGDVTGFIRKMQYTVSNETGLGSVVMEIMYI